MKYNSNNYHNVQTNSSDIIDEFTLNFVNQSTHKMIKIFCFIDSIFPDVKTINHLFELKMTNNNLTHSYFKIDCPKRKYRRSIFGIEESNLIQYPMNYLLSSIRSIANVAIKPMSWTTNQLLNLIYEFMINVALPWLYRFLNEIKKLNILPSRLNDLIELFNNIYHLMKLFGYINWFLVFKYLYI